MQTPDHNDLTPREREVIALVVDGRSSREIATELGISTATARTHLEHIMDKYGVHNRVQLAVEFTRRKMAEHGA